jgi:cysteine synthase
MNARVEEIYQYDEQVFDSVADLIPSPENPTPMLRLGERFNPHSDYEVLLKLEGMNPFGSIKDRTAQYLLQGLNLEEGQSLVAIPGCRGDRGRR